MRRQPPTTRISEFQQGLLAWYGTTGRRFPWRNRSAANYERVVAEVLLQRTRVETVACFVKGFMRQYPSWARLAEATLPELQEVLRPIGLWRRRAASLYALARELSTRRGRFPAMRDEIARLPGLGQYITNAVLLFCHGKPEPLLDVNMARVLERVFGTRDLADIRYDPYLQRLSRRVANCPRPMDINWAVLDLAGLVCRRRDPLCHLCPIRGLCKYERGRPRCVERP